MKLSGAEIIINLLERQGIDTIAGIPGGSNLPLYNALYKSKVIKHILVRQEQAGGFLAQGMARSTGKTAVCFATSGPGAVNLITAIADARLDSIPIVAITGQVGHSLIGTDAFQEVDTYGMTVPITKCNFLVRSAAELLTVIPEAFRIAASGRPGPVLVDVPKDVQLQQVELNTWPQPGKKDDAPAYDNSLIKEAAEMINGAKRPVIYAGGGAMYSDMSQSIIKLAEKNSIPTTVTLMGLGLMPHDHPLYLGMLGMHGARYTNNILHESDLLIALGVRFDDRATGKLSEFCPNAKVIHIDIDKSEIGKLRKPQIGIVGDLAAILPSLIEQVSVSKREYWISQVQSEIKKYPWSSQNTEDGMHPLELIRKIADAANGDAIVTTDVGQHQMWVAQGYPLKHPRTLLSSGGLGTMGFGLPAALGAARANPKKQVICFTGDGSILMNIQELATLDEHKLNVKIILF
ncbi:MAG: biosynthetic-type acetolactate synthase large subunit, partial [Chitinispirillales bacterium]|nr:biosynthetic-type acetolactate synthase large subunit [Chitinispirillales bacterium]